MSEVIRLPVRPFARRLLTKRQLASNSVVRPAGSSYACERACRSCHASRCGSMRADLDAVTAWLDERSTTPGLPLEQRVAKLEREVSTLVAELKRSAG